MPKFVEGTDLFDGLRVLPRESEQLMDHLSRINHTLQTRYLIPVELAEFSLQPDRSDDFYRLYAKEIQRVVSLLSDAPTTRRAIKVQVDPKKLLGGAMITYTHNENDKNIASNRSGDFYYRNIYSGGSHTGVENLAQLASPPERKEILPCHNLVDKMSQPIQLAPVIVDPATPASALPTGLNLEDILSTTGGLIDSTARLPKDASCLFSTPPEFKGFSGAPAYTPSESYKCSP
ncbi:unnamed protein product [Phytomonas sp. EM1]|nr:unnamed protein product [Phytomonas sp. EM1]|eukprot:CCW62814.1 unnamed protein product [Phytomonas sp. isolate EM1]